MGGGMVSSFPRPRLAEAEGVLMTDDGYRVVLGRAAGDEVGDRDRSQKTNDGHHDHDFNQCEACLSYFVEFHSFTVSIVCGVN